MSEPVEKSWTLAGLAEETGLSRRTIRYYIARGLLDGPLKAGRGSRYGRRHLERLRLIQRHQAEGKTLAAIARDLSGAAEAPLPEPEVWQSFTIAPDVTAQVRGDVTPWRMKQIRDGLRELMASLGEADRKAGQEQEGDSE